MTDFLVSSCHNDRAGRAHVVIINGDSGTRVAIENLPFRAAPGVSLREEQAAVLAIAAELARRAADFLDEEQRRDCVWPTRQPRIGPAPEADAEPNVFGYPTQRRG